MGHSNSKPKKNIPPDELMRLMSDNANVVAQFFYVNQEFIEKYIVEHFWEEDVERWLAGIRQRSPVESLKVRKIDFQKAKNGAIHHTSLYNNKSLIVRRSAEFDIDVYFGNRDFDSKRDDMMLIFGIGDRPSQAAGTKHFCSVESKPENRKKWYCYITSSGSKKMSIKVHIPSNAVVGRYAVSVEIVSGISSGRVLETHDDNSIIVLFNPYSPDDTVYMESDDQRQEYVMNDSGFIPRGSYYRISHKNWDYAQFDEGVLDGVLNMISNDSRLISQPNRSRKKCNDPVYVSRVLSAMVNCNDDRGVLFGRWDGNYEDGKSPGYWSDSATILKRWVDTGMRPVKYGQCWVFAAVLTTALRALGIPSRCITNFASAHDTNANVTVDMYYDEDTGEKMAETSDSVWNFHVWNEGWFARPDLPEGYDGWQVVDATPQEVSEVDDIRTNRRQIFQCGPAPVKAIKEGRINLGYDGNFIFGEVNADKVNWMVKNGIVSRSAGVLKRDVGRNISTKAVQSYERVDVTNEYKYSEGSTEEREAFARAYARGTMNHSLTDILNPELLIEPKFVVTVQSAVDDVYVGDKVNVNIKIENITDRDVNALVRISSSTKRHVGSTHARLKAIEEIKSLAGREITDIGFDVEPSDYLLNIVDNKIVNIRAVVSDREDGNTAVNELDVHLDIPDCISSTAPATVPRGSVTKFNVTIKNKLPFALTNGRLEIIFRGSTEDDVSIKLDQSLAPREIYTLEDVKVSPSNDWVTVYGYAVFQSAELKDLLHQFTMTVV